MVTNFEKIKNDMDIKQLAKVFKMKTCEECYACVEGVNWKNCEQTSCWCFSPEHYENWLKEEYKGEENYGE